jgi:hypothetical protein
VGNVSRSQLFKTFMPKYTLDAGWTMLKTMLGHKRQQSEG